MRYFFGRPGAYRGVGDWSAQWRRRIAYGARYQRHFFGHDLRRITRVAVMGGGAGMSANMPTPLMARVDYSAKSILLRRGTTTRRLISAAVSTGKLGSIMSISQLQPPRLS